MTVHLASAEVNDLELPGELLTNPGAPPVPEQNGAGANEIFLSVSISLILTSTNLVITEAKSYVRSGSFAARGRGHFSWCNKMTRHPKSGDTGASSFQFSPCLVVPTDIKCVS